MGKEYVLAMNARREGKEKLGLRQHFGDIAVLGVYAQAKFYGKELPLDWKPIEDHISSCELCQYDVSNIMSAIQSEEEARMEFLLPELDANSQSPQL